MLEWSRNMALEEELYARLRRKHIQDRPEIHFSDTLYCLTKAYWNKVAPIPVDNATLGLFAIGFALEDVLLKDYPIPGHANVEPYEYEGVWFSPDYLVTAMVGEMDLKTTRMWSTPDGKPKVTSERPYGFPTSWLKQFMGYAYRLGANPPDAGCDVEYVDYSVAIMYLMPGTLVAGTIRFAWDIVELNMAHHLHRASVLEDQLSQGIAPVPFAYNEPWECKNCVYYNRCLTPEPGG